MHIYLPGVFPRTAHSKDIDVNKVVVIGACVLVVLLLAVCFITYTATKRHTKSQMGKSTAPPAVAVPEEAAMVHSSLKFSRMHIDLLHIYYISRTV